MMTTNVELLLSIGILSTLVVLRWVHQNRQFTKFSQSFRKLEASLEGIRRFRVEAGAIKR